MHYLLCSERQAKRLEEIAHDVWDFVFATPPCTTLSRAVFANMMGPQPVRSADWPHGLPWLKPSDREKCDVGPALACFALKTMEAMAKACVSGRPCLRVVEHPEDLGSAALGNPASI